MKEGAAHGKVILFGEHAVVYGEPAIAVGIDRGARATARRGTGKSTLYVRGWELRVEEGDSDSDLGRAWGAMLQASAPCEPVDVEIFSDLPPGGGLGCSAAMGVAIARALSPETDPARVLERAMAWERVFHGNPSGIDATVALYGGSIFFRKGDPFMPLPIKGGLTLCIGGTGIASSTRAMVETVRQLCERKPDIAKKSFEAIASVVRNARLALLAGDTFAVGRLMDLNQMLLSGLMVSQEDIERLCSLARDVGALGAKLTGAGGGGSVVALAKGQSEGEAILEAWGKAGYSGFVTRVAPSLADSLRPREVSL